MGVQMTTETKESQREFKDWLSRRGLTPEQFAKSVPELHVSTVYLWLKKKDPAAPRDSTKSCIRRVHPDCPVVNW